MFPRTLVLSAAFAASALSAHACSIPVFRYALDRWPADKFVLEVAPAHASEEGVARFLRNFTDSTPLNLTPFRLKDGSVSRLTFPHPEPGTADAWSGPLDGATLSQLVESPARAEIVRRIISGESAVWVLVESGKSEADTAIAAALEKRLRYLEQASVLPPIDPNDPTSKLGPGPKLGVKFSLLRIRNDDVAERGFVQMLAGPKPDPALRSGAWIAVIFGRGRTLGAWPAEGFGTEQIDEVSTFLLGACSCEVKRMNPGWDLLMKADWDAELADAEQKRISAATAAGAPPEPPAPSVVPETVVFDPQPQAAPSHAPEPPVDQRRLTLQLLGASFAFVLVASSAGKFLSPR